VITTIGFDADDTLWHNVSIFEATEERFAELLAAYHPHDQIRERLFATEMKNLAHFGYGVKGFTLSMIETALELTERRITGPEIAQVLEWGHQMLREPVLLIDGVRNAIEALSGRYRLMLITKGDLFDQESKLARSGIGEHFQAVEIVSDKTAKTYGAIVKRHDIDPSEFVMVGNSLKSDVLPALEAGAHAVHIPYVTTWHHERVDPAAVEGKTFTTLDSLLQLPDWLAG
jgi:putative hydrolase of the HAD superfamily